MKTIKDFKITISIGRDGVESEMIDLGNNKGLRYIATGRYFIDYDGIDYTQIEIPKGCVGERTREEMDNLWNDLITEETGSTVKDLKKLLEENQTKSTEEITENFGKDIIKSIKGEE